LPPLLICNQQVKFFLYHFIFFGIDSSPHLSCRVYPICGEGGVPKENVGSQTNNLNDHYKNAAIAPDLPPTSPLTICIVAILLSISFSPQLPPPHAIAIAAVWWEKYFLSLASIASSQVVAGHIF
jgi:hypothetical protein